MKNKPLKIVFVNATGIKNIPFVTCRSNELGIEIDEDIARQCIREIQVVSRRTIPDGTGKREWSIVPGVKSPDSNIDCRGSSAGAAARCTVVGNLLKRQSPCSSGGPGIERILNGKVECTTAISSVKQSSQ